MYTYSSFERFLSEVVYLDLELYILPVEEEALSVESVRNALIIDGNIESHLISDLIVMIMKMH